jgi:hypothetical protein
MVMSQGLWVEMPGWLSQGKACYTCQGNAPCHVWF